MPTSRATRCFAAFMRSERWLGNAVIAVLLLQIVVLAQHTFAWRYGEDVGFFYYFSWLVNERGYLPYRDLHETSFPGSFLLYSLFTRIGGYSVLAYNITHMLLFAVLCTAAYRWLHRIDKRLAIATIALFGSLYFFMHRSMHMQRDMLVLLFVLSALAAMTSSWRLPVRATVTGVLFGIASAIKPHAALAAPFAVLAGAVLDLTHDNLQQRNQLYRHLLLATALSFAAFIAVWLALGAWMVNNGSWPHFWRMFNEYMPLYQKMNGIHIAQSAAQRWQNAWDWMSGQLLVGATPIAAGIAFCFYNPALARRQKLQVLLLALLWPVYVAYVGLGGKFWDYHQIPMHFFYCALLSLGFIPFAVRSWKTLSLRLLYLVVLVLFIQSNVSPSYALAVACLTGDPVCDTEEEAAYAMEDQLEQFLRQHVPAGERVEPLATSTLGPLFPALLRAGIEPATPYVEGFPLYHDADSDYVQDIRADMLARLQRQPPRFIIRPVNFFAPGGATASPFSALDQFISEHYQPATAQCYPSLAAIEGITVFERKGVSCVP